MENAGVDTKAEEQVTLIRSIHAGIRRKGWRGGISKEGVDDSAEADGLIDAVGGEGGSKLGETNRGAKHTVPSKGNSAIATEHRSGTLGRGEGGVT